MVILADTFPGPCTSNASGSAKVAYGSDGANTVSRTERPLNVCYLIDELRTGGTETQLLQLIKHFDRARVVPHLCLLDGTRESSRLLEPTDCSIARLGVRKLLSVRTLRKSRDFARLLKSWQIDLLQVYFPDSTYFGVPTAKWAGVPCAVRTRRDLFYWVTPTHRRWGRYLDKVLNRYLVDGIIVNSNAVKVAAIKDEQLSAERIEVIPNGLDLARFSDHSTRQINSLPLKVGIVSMLRPEKRVDLFVEASLKLAVQFQNVEFVIAGDGPERTRLDTMTKHSAAQDRVRFLGVVQDIPTFLEGLDIAVLCSDTEGLSNALVEYMASGLPIVATAVGGNTTLLEDGETALLVPPGDPLMLADAIATLIKQPQQRTKLGSQAKRVVAQQFDIESTVKQHERYYRQLLQERSGAKMREVAEIAPQ